MSKKEKKAPQQEDFLAKEAKEEAAQAPAYTLDIPEDEIWTYHIEGLQEPRIGKPVKNFRQKKVFVVIILLIAIGLAIFFSLRAVHNETYKYNVLDDGTYELVKFSNPGNITTLTIDKAQTEDAKPITVLHEFAFNCDEMITEITIGKDVKEISGKTFYSCWALRNIKVAPENEAYCDVDGVLYNKDKTTLICYPIDHDKYLREKFGYTDLKDDNGKPMEELWGTTETYDEAFLAKYNKETRTYVVPSTVTTLGELCLNYSNIVDLYLPEGLKTIETFAVFKNTVLQNIYGYRSDAPVEDTTAEAIASFAASYPSLPDGLEYIGSDAFTYDQGLSYMYIPASVTHIGHHAFWDTCYNEDGEVKGVNAINVAAEKDAFKDNTELGDQWRPEYDHHLFKKAVDVNYGAQRAE
jgi:hypothetical protein